MNQERPLKLLPHPHEPHCPTTSWSLYPKFLGCSDSHPYIHSHPLIQAPLCFGPHLALPFWSLHPSHLSNILPQISHTPLFSYTPFYTLPSHTLSHLMSTTAPNHICPSYWPRFLPPPTYPGPPTLEDSLAHMP